MNSSRTILIVEDNDDDFEACGAALSGKDNIIIDRCETGDEAIDYLFFDRSPGESGSRPMPELILLDLNLPGISGREVLEKIKSDQVLKNIPVVVLSTSSYIKDIEECYRIGANSFVQKPLNLDGFLKNIELLYDYWFELARIPRTTC